MAVLPFYNSSADSTLTFGADWFNEEVASALARVPGIVIKSRSGARAYQGELAVDVGEAGAKLKADYVLTALVRQDNGRWILSADLGRQSDAASVWAQNFVLQPDQQASAAERIAQSGFPPRWALRRRWQPVSAPPTTRPIASICGDRNGSAGGGSASMKARTCSGRPSPWIRCSPRPGRA
jgi:TolB-like protein